MFTTDQHRTKNQEEIRRENHESQEYARRNVHPLKLSQGTETYGCHQNESGTDINVRNEDPKEDVRKSQTDVHHSESDDALTSLLFYLLGTSKKHMSLRKIADVNNCKNIH